MTNNLTLSQKDFQILKYYIDGGILSGFEGVHNSLYDIGFLDGDLELTSIAHEFIKQYPYWDKIEAFGNSTVAQVKPYLARPEEEELPDESRIFIPGRLTDFEENLFLKHQVTELISEREVLKQELSDFMNRTAAGHRINELRQQVDQERERNMALLAELDRLNTIYEMAGIKQTTKHNGLNSKKKRQRIQ